MGGVTGNLTYEQLREAFLEALSLSGIGGGGGGLTFPDLVVTGTGAYSIPVGFNGIAKVNTKNGETFSINGAVVLSSDGVTWNTMYSNSPPTTSLARFTRFIGGGTDTVYRRSMCTPSPNLENQFGSESPADTFANATAQEKNNATQIFTLPEGTLITGGRYLVELYAI